MCIKKVILSLAIMAELTTADTSSTIGMQGNVCYAAAQARNYGLIFFHIADYFSIP